MKAVIPFILTITFASVGTVVVVDFSGWISERPSYANEIILLLASSTLIIYFYLLQWSKRRPELFTQFYLLSIALKLVAYGTIIGLIIYFDQGGAVENAVLFLICYLLFTLIEVAFLFRRIGSSRA